jgi:bifunctional non-homologous end joining protein LigD
VIDPSTGLTKLALVRYYESVAERILPHLVDRPVSLVRAPEGITGELFFQKHPETRMPGCASSTRRSGPATRRCSRSTRPTRLVSAAQMNTVEFHTWNSTAAGSTSPTA